MIDRLRISFSGGETSALMTLLLLRKWRDRFQDVQVVFANTGQEREETLEFVQQCDRAFGFGVVWVEANIHPTKGQGTTHRVVSYETASREGEPFEAYIAKHGIPNQSHPKCTTELKTNPMHSYSKSQGWKKYVTAIGIRSDEMSRVRNDKKLVYPLAQWAPITKDHVNAFWERQPFRLNLMGYQGNCKWCWKKSNKKLMAVMQDNPRHFDFPERMEARYGLVGPEFAKYEGRPARVFFRGNRSTLDLRKEYAAGIEGDEVQEDLGCIESCEAF